MFVRICANRQRDREDGRENDVLLSRRPEETSINPSEQDVDVRRTIVQRCERPAILSSSLMSEK